MKKFLILLLVFPFALLAQDSFPSSWMGIWQGELTFYPERDQDTIKVSLEIAKTDIPGTYSWKTSYSSPKLNTVKDYLLRERDSSKGIYEIDEQDGIMIPCRYFDNELWSILEVEGTIIIGLYSMKDEELSVTFPSGKTELAEFSRQFDGEDSPEVKSFPISASQKIVLTRVTEK